jgi:hypothetical protein
MAISPGKRPWAVSYLSKWASVLISVRSFIATTSTCDFFLQGPEGHSAYAAESIYCYFHFCILLVRVI